jgi:hypothetical protein
LGLSILPYVLIFFDEAGSLFSRNGVGTSILPVPLKIRKGLQAWQERIIWKLTHELALQSN